MDPAEIEFLAEQETVSVIPKFTDNRVIHLISGDIGPFRAGLPVLVPIWVAVSLRKRNKCKIVAPDWMELEALQELLEHEKNSRFFTKMPTNHYMGIAHLLLGTASEDINHADEIRTAIKDLWDLRIAKARSSADAFLKSDTRHAGVDHITQLEICTLRPLLLDGLDVVHHLNASEPQLNNTSIFTRSQSTPLG